MLQLGRRKLEFRKMLLVAALYLEARGQEGQMKGPSGGRGCSVEEAFLEV